MSVRVRIAPAPTGLLHVGNARSALYNWLHARHEEGVFVVRIDDTDRERSRPEHYLDIIESLRWLGLDWDEGVEVGGPHAPYRQSERLDRYRQVAEQFLEEGQAYRCFCTAEELGERRRRATAEGRPPGYDGRCRTIDRDQARSRVEMGEAASLRFAVPRPGETRFEDLIRGELRFEHQHIDDFVLLRSDGSPTYHLASSVDDVDFRISHVIRGEDLLSSTPKHILICRAMAAEPAVYAHLSLLLGPDGQKLSKRHGAVSVRHYRESGYLPEAMVNYLAILGWTHDPETTIYTRDEMVELFELERVSKNPAAFDLDKLEWMNGVYVRELEPDDFAERARPFVEGALERELSEAERERFREIAPLVQERVKVLAEVPGMMRWLFVAEVDFEPDSWGKVMGWEEAPLALTGALQRLEALEDWSTEGVERELRAMLDEHELSARKGFQPLRVAVTGSTVSPPLFESLAALGKEETLSRLRRARERL